MVTPNRPMSLILFLGYERDVFVILDLTCLVLDLIDNLARPRNNCLTLQHSDPEINRGSRLESEFKTNYEQSPK
jgi:hypothetical protein